MRLWRAVSGCADLRRRDYGFTWAHAMTADIVELLRDTKHSFTGTRRHQAADEIERLRAVITPELNYRDLEMKVRDGTINVKSVLGEGSEVAMRWLATIMWHAILGDVNEEPENYRMAEFSIKPSGCIQYIKAAIEIIKPGGKSSHEIRRDLEAEIERLRARVAELEAWVDMHSTEVPR